MTEQEWPKPPIAFEDLPKLIELLGGWAAAKREMAGWVLVPSGSLESNEPQHS